MGAGSRSERGLKFFSKKRKYSALMPVYGTDAEDAPAAFFFREYPLHKFRKRNWFHPVAHFMPPLSVSKSTLS